MMSKWIKNSQQQPLIEIRSKKYYEKYLIYEDGHFGRRTIIGHWDLRRGGWTDVRGFSVAVLYWQPLPNPPEDTDDD